MSFEYKEYFILLILCFIIFSYLIIKYEKGYFSWVQDYWKLNISKNQKLSRVFYLLSFLLIFLSLLDFRGSPKRIEHNISDQKTIILIDTSASMLAEDIRPSRFKKAIILARHFVKKAVGHQISIVVFSDNQKRLVPFTDDSDLLDSRLASLESLNLKDGGSNITLALAESIQYFIVDAGGKEGLKGNILLLTDSEENSESIDLNIPEGITLAAIGVGTLNGGTIPIRSRDGYLKGYKRYNSKDIITKLNENFLKKLSEKVSNYKYWIALSYSLPTEDVISFFRNIYQSSLSSKKLITRPVYLKYLMIPAILLYFLHIILFCRSSYVVYMITIFLLSNNIIHAQNINSNVEQNNKEKELSNYLKELIESNYDKKEKLRIAQKLLESNMNKEALILYKESISNPDNTDIRVLFNYAVALIKNKKVNEGIKIYDYIRSRIDKLDSRSKEDINKNILLALNVEKQQQSKKEDSNKKNNKGQNNKQDGKNNNKQNSSNKSSNNDSESKKNQKDKQQQKSEEEKDEQQSNNSKDSNKKDKKNHQNVADREKYLKRKKNMVKIPAILKKITSEDGKLQKKYMNTSIRGMQRDRKSW